MNTVLSLILMVSQNSLKNDPMYIISRYIIHHINELNDMTIRTLAESCYTSTTSVVRFYEMLGFNSYVSFKKNLLTSIKTRKLQLINKYEEVDMNSYFDNIQNMSIEKINKEVFVEQIQRCTDYIRENKKIHFYGAMFPLALTLSFAEDMIIMGIPTELHQIHFGDLKHNREDGIHFVITLTGRFKSFHKTLYNEMSIKDNKTILLSQDIFSDHMLMNINVPKTVNYDYGELITLMILDMIKLTYYKKYF